MPSSICQLTNLRSASSSTDKSFRNGVIIAVPHPRNLVVSIFPPAAENFFVNLVSFVSFVRTLPSVERSLAGGGSSHKAHKGHQVHKDCHCLTSWTIQHTHLQATLKLLV